jgi:RNA polymerase sigma-70 factor (ECF subfamily)
MKTPDPDRPLVLEVLRGSREKREEAFRELYERHKDRVYNLCYRITGNGADALDASQATFCSAFRNVERFRFSSRFSSWLYRIAVNACLDLRRRAGTSCRSAPNGCTGRGELLEGIRDASSDSPVESMERAEAQERVRAAVSRLSPRLRTVVSLRYFEHLSYERISEVLRISLGTVKSRVFRAHEALSGDLGPFCDAGGLR